MGATRHPANDLPSGDASSLRAQPCQCLSTACAFACGHSSSSGFKGLRSPPSAKEFRAVVDLCSFYVFASLNSSLKVCPSRPFTRVHSPHVVQTFHPHISLNLWGFLSIWGTRLLPISPPPGTWC